MVWSTQSKMDIKEVLVSYPAEIIYKYSFIAGKCLLRGEAEINTGDCSITQATTVKDLNA